MIRIGTRGSALAQWQAKHIAGLIGKEKTEIVIIKTKGDVIRNVSFDKMEGKGFFTREIEEALLDKRIDCAVHSLKDLPVEDTPGLAVAAVTEREDPSDVLLIRSDRYNNSAAGIPLSQGALVGTSSLRRSAQILHEKNDLRVMPLRGNVTTRVRRLREKRFDAIIIARAGLSRLGIALPGLVEFTLPYSYFLPAPGQGALAVQIREEDEGLMEGLNFLNHGETERAVRAERVFLNSFGAGCHMPLGALAYIDDRVMHLSGVIASPDGTGMVRESVSGTDPEIMGRELADIMKKKGADLLI